MRWFKAIDSTARRWRDQGSNKERGDGLFACKDSETRLVILVYSVNSVDLGGEPIQVGVDMPSRHR